MLRRIGILFVLLFILVSCSKKCVDVVVYTPKNPKAGEKITINFFPKRLVKPEHHEYSVYLIYQLFAPQGVMTKRIQMDEKKDKLMAEIATKPGDYFLSLKFEDSMDRFEDNKGCGWNISINDIRGNVQRNSFYQLGSIYNRNARSINFPDYKKAIQLYKQELSLFPENYKVWLDLWYSSFMIAANPSNELKKNKVELDSLLIHESESAELLALAFNTNLKLLNNANDALKIGERILSDYKEYSKKNEIAYSIIFLKNGSKQKAVVTNLKAYAKQTKNKEYLKKAYFQLGGFYRQHKNLDKAAKYFEKYIKIDPASISTRLILAKYYLKRGESELSQKMIDESRKLNSEDLYLKLNPWDDPVERESKLDLTLCQILSTQAALDFEVKNFRRAIRDRKKCIELRTPFPAYEWEKIGDIYLRMAEIDSARKAYIKAVSINSSQDGAIDKLKIIFQRDGKSLTKFAVCLNDAVKKELRASAKAAPLVKLTDLNGNELSLTKQKGKITVLVFWDTWSDACKKEIPGLNELKESFRNNSDVLFWAVSVETPVSINKFIPETPFNFHLFCSGIEAKRKFKVIGFPTHFIIDADGKIRFAHVGFSRNISSELKREIQILIDESKSLS